MVHALRSRRVITPHGEPDAAVIIDAEQILAVEPASELSPTILFEVLDNLALLPVLVDVRIHINEPGRIK